MSDIVTRLREATVPRLEMGWPAPHVVQRKEPLWLEAADKIQRLRAELAAAIKQREDARRWLRDACAEIARTRLGFYDTLTPQQIAERNGWDCFPQKEGGGA